MNRRDFLSHALACGVCASAGLSSSAGTAKAGAHPTSLRLSEMQVCAASAFPTWDGIVETRPPSPHATQALNWLLHTMGIKGNFTLLEGTFSKGFTAIAGTHSRHEGRFIVYDAAKFQWTPDQPDWEEITIIGHEIGHHANGDTGWRRSHNREAWDRELAADRTAGHLVSRLGGALEDAQAFFHRLSNSPSETHPPRDLRLQAVAQGWHQANNLKDWEEPACQTQWLGDAFDINGANCRMVQHCDSSPAPQLACENVLGDWILK